MNSAGLRGSRKLHDGMVNSLLRAPMSFFHANPHGRIINRFTKDVTDIDKLMIMFTSMVLRNCTAIRDASYHRYRDPIHIANICSCNVCILLRSTLFSRDFQRIETIRRDNEIANICPFL